VVERDQGVGVSDDREFDRWTKGGITMSTWRRGGFSGILLGMIGLAILLPGCGSGGGPGNTTGPNPEVKVVEPVDAQGKTISISDETKSPAK